ncbi:MAG: IS66 family transposase [Sediminibacterium sp.]|nr:IS66 family transposase [Sediminibacterium sp.]
MEQNSENIDYKDAYQAQILTIESLRSESEKQQFTIQNLQLQLAQLNKLVFGSRHEKFVSTDTQMAPTLFDIPPIAELLDNITTTVAYEKTSKQLRPNHPGRNSFPENLRREERIINPEGIDPALLKKIGEDVTETLAYKPAELFVKKLIRPKYLDVATNSLYQALAPGRSFERSNVDTSLIAQIIVEKFIDHLPLDRQIKRFARLGVTISDSTMGNWVTASAAYLKPLYEAHKQLVLASGYLHADETIIKVLDSDKKNATHQGYYWVYQCNANKLVLFDYRTGRGREGPQSILKEYKGYLQTDGYIVYEDFDKNPDIIVFNCMAHARRKFSEALSNDKPRAEYVLSEIQKLYAIERQLTDNNLTGDEKLQYRKEQALPILKDLGLWMQKTYTEVLPASAIGKAIAYSLPRWDKLSLYATTDFLHIDNNPVENSIRPVAVGRKNYLFAGSHAAAQRSAIFYSLLATCKNYQVNPTEWMQDVLTRIAGYPINKIQELLPQNWKPTPSE